MLRSRNSGALSALLLAAFAACGDSAADGSGTGSGGSSGSGGTIVGPNAPTYQEAAEVTNGDPNGGEPTGFTLGDDGFVIEGSFEAADATTDAYVFNTGTWGGAGQPDFPGIDVYTFIDGKRYDSSQSDVHFTLDTVVSDGFSALSGGGFINAAVTSGVDYNLAITGNASLAGKDYRIEVRGHAAE